jgi:hypothetical protein
MAVFSSCLLNVLGLACVGDWASPLLPVLPGAAGFIVASDDGMALGGAATDVLDDVDPAADDVTGVGGSDAFWHPAMNRTAAERTIDMRLIFMNASTI